MKTSILIILTFSLLISSSCRKAVTAPELRQQSVEKVLGKWTLDRQVNEVYSPLTTLSSTDEYVGTDNDFYIFKTNQLAEVNSLQTGYQEVLYNVINPSQIGIDKTVWRIEKLTTNEMHLLLDTNDAVQYKRYVTKMYLKR